MTDEFNLIAFLIAQLIYLQMLADGVIPNEYGINPKQKLKIGSKVKKSWCKESCKFILTILKQIPYNAYVMNKNLFFDYK